MSKQSYRVCLCFRRRFKLAVAQAPEDVKNLFEMYSENGLMNADGLHKFLVESQKEDETTRDDAQKIIDGSKHLPKNGLHVEAFFRHLLSDTNSPQVSLGVTISLSLIVIIISFNSIRIVIV